MFGLFKKKPKIGAIHDDGTDQQMRLATPRLVRAAQDIGKEHNITLDLSETSLHNVDKILEIYRQQMLASGVTDPEAIRIHETTRGVAHIFAHYIVTCLEQNHMAGTWVRYGDHKELAFTVGGLLAFPPEWCTKRLANGNEDNVTYKYNQFIQLLTQKNNQ